MQRSPVRLICADGAPCSGITLSNVNMWSQTNKAVYKCESAYGTGLSCIRADSGGAYAVMSASLARPAGYTPAGDDERGPRERVRDEPADPDAVSDVLWTGWWRR